MSASGGTAEQIQLIPLEQIKPSEGNRRVGGFDPAKLEQLADSIRAVGVQQPAVVRRSGEGYELVAGERRWRAARLAGLETLPCVVRELDEVTVLKIQTIENLQREDIHPLDEADGYSRLIDRAGYDVEHLAQEVGRSPSYVYQRLKLRDLIEPARKMLAKSKLTAGHGILIARLPAEQQKELVEWLGEGGGSWGRDEPVSVRQLDEHIHRTILLELSKAAFKKDDADLDPKAGPCTSCPKRTGYQPALFADVCNGGKRDYCTDPPCFQGKLAALIQRRHLELEASGEEHLLVCDGATDYREQQAPEKDGVLMPYKWEECKKKDPGALRCLVVAGKSAGRLTWGRARKENRFGRPEPTPEEKARKKAEREVQKASVARRQKAYEGILSKASEWQADGVSVLDNIEILRLVAELVFERTWDQDRKKIQRMLQWPASNNWEDRRGVQREQLGAMDGPALRQFILTCLAVPMLDVSSYGSLEKARQMVQLAKALDVEVKELEEEVAAGLAREAEERERWEREESEYEEDEDFEDDEEAEASEDVGEEP